MTNSPTAISKSAISALVQSQRAFFATGKTRDPEFRIEALKKFRDIITRHEAEIAEALTKDFRKPYLESFSTEIANVLVEIRHVIKGIRKWSKPRRVSTPLVLQPGRSRIYPEPYGASLIIAPWNYPFQLQIMPLIGAIAAGNTAIIKPSEVTTAMQKLLGSLIAEAFAPEYVACVGGGVAESQMLLDERFDFILFTGSTRVGRIVMEKAAKHLTPVVLELGGKSPCIVDTSIDMKVAARRIVWGKYLNCGQSCVAPDYLLIPASIYDSFLNEMKNVIGEFYGADPKQSSDFARVVNDAHFDRLAGLLDKNKVFCGGQTDRASRYIAPTILKDIAWNDKIMEEEIFGPLLPCIKYDNLSEALAQVKARPKPLALYVFSSDKSVQERVLRDVSYGGACVNDTMVHLVNPELPFGGVGESGMGGYHGEHSFDVFSHMKSVVKKPFAFDMTMRYPPYTDYKMKLLRFFLK
jgi:aldehyde dehydrogenase (NAD+)